MRRVMLLAILAMALPMAALANSVNFNITPAQFGGGSIFSGYGSVWDAAMLSNTSDNLRIVLTGLNLSQPCHAGATCTFTSGTVTVLTRSTDVTLFTSGLLDGTLTRTSVDSTTITSKLVALPTFGFLHMAFTTNGASGMTSGSAQVATPEPDTLGLLGTGLIGLAGLTRTKLKRHET
jgi:hypothetical protein